MKRPELPLPRHPKHDTAYRVALSRLRHTWETEERAIVGLPAIAEYLTNTIGLRANKRPISTAMVNVWFRKRGLPLITIFRPWSSTNLMLLAWLWTYDVHKQLQPKRVAKS